MQGTRRFNVENMVLGQGPTVESGNRESDPVKQTKPSAPKPYQPSISGTKDRYPIRHRSQGIQDIISQYKDPTNRMTFPWHADRTRTGRIKPQA
jgi:hypothetical protein